MTLYYSITKQQRKIFIDDKPLCFAKLQPSTSKHELPQTVGVVVGVAAGLVYGIFLFHKVRLALASSFLVHSSHYQAPRWK
jgi:hypothetical protein